MQPEIQPPIGFLTSAIADLSAETRIRVSAIGSESCSRAETNVTRSLHPGWSMGSTTDASGLARFLSVDPELNMQQTIHNPQGWNRYSYVQNNPINKTDPTGRCSWAVLLAFAPACTTFDTIDYVRERGSQVVEAVQGTRGGASTGEKVMGGMVIGAIAIEIATNAIEPEKAALETRLGNIFGKELTEATISAAAREVHGEVVATKGSGAAFDHVAKMNNAMSGAKGALETLKKWAVDSRLTDAQRQQVRQTLSKYSKKLDAAEKLYQNLVEYFKP